MPSEFVTRRATLDRITGELAEKRAQQKILIAQEGQELAEAEGGSGPANRETARRQATLLRERIGALTHEIASQERALAVIEEQHHAAVSVAAGPEAAARRRRGRQALDEYLALVPRIDEHLAAFAETMGRLNELRGTIDASHTLSGIEGLENPNDPERVYGRLLLVANRFPVLRDTLVERQSDMVLDSRPVTTYAEAERQAFEVYRVALEAEEREVAPARGELAGGDGPDAPAPAAPVPVAAPAEAEAPLFAGAA